MGDMLAAALDYAARGWSILPLCPPDHVGVGRAHRGCTSPGKRPFFPNVSESRSGEWKEYQGRRATVDEIRAWFDKNPRLNIGMALGSVTGLVSIDVDDEDGEELLLQLAGGSVPTTWEFSTGRGRRLLYRLPGGVHVKTTRFTRLGTEIEILKFQGHGAQTVMPPSVHPNGSVYRWKPLCDPDAISVADAPEWMHSTKTNETASTKPPAEGELICEGGRNNYLTTLAGAMRKRGADQDVILAALEKSNETRCDPPLSNAEVVAIARSMMRYAPDEFTAVSIKFPEPGKIPERRPGEYSRRFKWASELAAPPKADEWIWEGYLPKAAITLLSALWKAGKTTLMAHLLKACGSNGTFLGQPIRASKVLYVSEEGERHWVRRRDNLTLGDNVGFYLQPFATRPAPAEWLAFIADLKADVETHGFDLVVFDTLAKLWPVKEENNAGDVDAALMPLWEITKAGAGILLIHHLRKSGGQEYTASRGSGAISAFPDIIVELKRFDGSDDSDRKRVLKAKGRYDETPDELTIELDDGPGGEYRVVSNKAPTDTPTILFTPETEEEKVLAILGRSEEPWLSVEQIRAELRLRNWGIRNKDLNTHLFSLYARKQVVIRGVVRSKTTPREYALTSRVGLVPPVGIEGNETFGNEDGDDD